MKHCPLKMGPLPRCVAPFTVLTPLPLPKSPQVRWSSGPAAWSASCLKTPSMPGLGVSRWILNREALNSFALWMMDMALPRTKSPWPSPLMRHQNSLKVKIWTGSKPLVFGARPWPVSEVFQKLSCKPEPLTKMLAPKPPVMGAFWDPSPLGPAPRVPASRSEISFTIPPPDANFSKPNPPKQPF